MTRRHYIALAFLLLALLAVGLTARPLVAKLSSPTPLKLQLEGPFIDNNFRDLGASMNACLGRQSFTEGAALRSGGWFSGWSCSRVGDPEAIYSLDYEPEKGAHAFCLNDGGHTLVGQSFNPTLKLNDLEFRKTWDDPDVRRNACGFFQASYSDLAAGKRVLVHCEAGRDRTGAYAALLEAVVAEAAGQLDEKMVNAIECDYEKSRSLKPYKYGRARSFIQRLIAEGGVAPFLAKECAVSPQLVARLRARLWSASP